jgi:signal transduction histidine kinase
VDLRDLLVETLAETGHLAVQRRLEVNLPKGGEVMVQGSESALAILLRNLLVNAFRYATEASTVRIRLAADDAVTLSIRNDCTPLAPEEMKHLRDRFYRVPGSQGHGAGLGLSIVERIAERHGARFEVSTLEEGGVFCATVSGLRRVA